MIYQEFHFYSPLLDTEAVRLSVADDASREFFAIIPRPERYSAYRERRDEMIDLICRAIDQGCEPGEVRTA